MLGSGRIVTWLSVLLAASVAVGAPGVVINEIHYNPDVKTERIEFLELFNNSSNAVDMSGWLITDGINFVFPTNTTIAPFGFKLIAENPTALQAKFGYAGALGPYTGSLSKYADKITLKNAQGLTENSVDYQVGFPWPTVGDPPGYSIELINPNLDNNLGGSWRASVVALPPGQASALLVPDHSTWSFFKGQSEASNPSNLWRQLSFNDATWFSGGAPIGYGESFIVTPLSDMRSNYTTVFFRKKFVVTNLTQIQTLQIDTELDDGAKIWINGTNVLNVNVPAGELAYNRLASGTVEGTNFTSYVITNAARFLVVGTNVIAVQALNSALASSTDFVMDLRVTARSGPSNVGPTPGRTNICYSSNAPPQVRQVDHSPARPQSGELVKITAKVTDPDGVTNVVLQYQIVNPGSYIQITDAAYTNNWTSVAMTDNGLNADVTAGDAVYSVDLPPSVQTHRRLIRYRIIATDSGGRSIRLPYDDDPQPNFAYFVYDGVPAWSGAVQPGASGTNGYVFTVSSNEMNRLPAYHLLAKSNSFATAIGWAPGTTNNQYTGDNFLWTGALIVDGKVYDHIGFRARGGLWRYSMGKNAMKFRLNRGHDLEVKDNWGNKLKTKWRRLSLRPNIQQASYLHRGEQGMFESIGYKMFELAGTPSLKTVQVQFRVVDDAREVVPGYQWGGDFYGLWLVVEEEDGRFLEERDMPDGNIYDMENWSGTLNHTGLSGPTDKSDLNYFISTYSNTVPPEAWWRTNLDLKSYYGFHTMIQGIHDFDVSAGKNYFYYRNPVNGLWQIWPWDLDLCWADNMGGVTGGDEPFKSRVLSDFANPGRYPPIGIEFRNRMREIRDLLFNTDEAWKLIDEHWWLTHGTEQWSITDADRGQWDYNPIMTNTAVVYPVQAGQGKFYQWLYEPGTSNNFGGCAQLMKKFVGYRATNTTSSLDTMSADTLKPVRPSLSYTGPANFPINRLTFHASSYSGSSGFASMQWRIAEITAPGALPFDPSEPRKYEIIPVWQTTNTVFVNDVQVPPTGLKTGHRYRVRVLVKDVTGRTSNWSLPVEFTLGEPDGAANLLNHFRITEIMYNPALGGYEYVEIHNDSPFVTLDLAGVKFTQGIDYTFPSGATLAPAGYALVIGTTNIAAFRAYYGLDASVPVFAAYTGSLNNAGELLTLRTSAGGTDIVSFNFRDGRGWPAVADGAGHSLVFSALNEAAQGSGAGDYGGNWRPSAYLRGSPGQAEPIITPGVLLNEIFANTETTNGFSNDWIELYNPTTNDITLGPDWYLSDDGAALAKWQIPSGTFVPAHGWVSFDEVTGFHNPTNIGFGISSAGEQVFLSYMAGSAEDRVVDAVSFKAQENTSSAGRYPDGSPYWFTLASTRDLANALPQAGVVISELMYHPPDIGGTNDNSQDEFIEIWNASGSAVPFFNTNGNWRIAGDVDFALPAMTLPANHYMLVVNFNPVTNMAQLAAFKSRYALTNAPILILGPYAGKLANSSARVAIEKPQPPDVAANPVPWAIVDEVLYSDQPPWPCGSDGTGFSLQRLSATGHGGDPLSWTAAVPSAGATYQPSFSTGPTITVQPRSATVPTNASVTFNVGVCSSGPLTYEWQMNGSNLPGATNATLTLINVQLTDTGNYRVVVANAAGSATSDEAALSVQFAPSITAQPQSLAVVAYTNVLFTVECGGSQPLLYQWRFNGTDLPGETRPTLVISNVQAFQAGTYSVRVSNVGGSIVSSNATLTVYMPASITSQPVSVSTNAGSNVIFQVSATGIGTLSYQWRKDGTNILGAEGAALSLTNVQLVDAGIYSVIVADAIGAMGSAPAVLTVILRPAIIVHPASVTILENEAVTISVVATGTPPLHYRWRKGTALYLIDGPPTLSFPAASIIDAGAYNVFVYSGVASGTVLSSNAVLTVLPDMDGDHIPDNWEAYYNFDTNNIYDAMIDSDGDGVNNLDEFTAGTDPRAASSFLELKAVLAPEQPATISLQFNAVSNRPYTLQTKEWTNSWSNLVVVAAAPTNRFISVSDSPSNNFRLYRLQIPHYP